MSVREHIASGDVPCRTAIDSRNNRDSCELVISAVGISVCCSPMLDAIASVIASEQASQEANSSHYNLYAVG